MKSYIISFFLIVTLALGQGTQINLYDYQLQTNAGVKTKNGKIGFVTMKPVKNPHDTTTFGYWISNNTNANAVFFELKEGQKTIASVTAKDFSAKAKLDAAGGVTSAVYSAGTGQNAYTVKIESSVISDTTMPLGKVVQLTVKVKTSGNKTLNGSLNLYADGFVRMVGTNGVSTSNIEKGKPVYPFALLIANAGSSIVLDPSEQKTAGKSVKVHSASISSSGNEVELITLRAHGTTVKSYDKSANQAANVESIISAKKEVTELALLNSASKTTPFPGDTITYTITYHNIGSSPAQDIVISNPIPVNTTYVDDSAAGEGTEISIDRRKVQPPQKGEVTSVTWKISKKIMPGEEGTVSLKAVVR